jgi:hypothetical protein
VLVLNPTLQYGGAETDIVRLLVRLDPAEFDVALYPFLAMGPLANDLERAGITMFPPQPVTVPKVESLSRRGQKPITLRSAPQRFIGGVRFLNGLVDRLPARRFDVIHAVLPNSYI